MISTVFLSDQLVKDAFSFYEKIAENLHDDIRSVQNERNHLAFKGFLIKAERDIKNIFDELCEIELNFPSELFRVEILHFSEMIVKIESLRASIELPCMLYVVGMGKAGKSSLLNALIGKDVAEVGTLPKTWKTDLFYSSPDKMVKILYRDGRDQLCTSEDARKIIVNEEDEREKSEDVIEQKFRETSKSLQNIAEKRVLRQELEDRFLYRSSIREVHWTLQDLQENSVLEKFSLVDTPGLSQINAGTHGNSSIRGEDIGDFYHQADGVLWVLDAMTLSASKPKEVLENLENSLSQTNSGERNFNNIIAVLNHADKVKKHGGEEALEKIVEMAKDIFGDKFVDVIPFSAKQAIDAQKKENSELLNMSGYNRLYEATNKFFYFNAVDLRISSKTKGLTGEIFTYQKNYFYPYLDRLQDHSEKLENRLLKADKDSQNLREQLESGWRVSFEKYKNKVNENIGLHAEALSDLPESEHVAFMERNIFEMSMLKKITSTYRISSVQKISEMVENYKKLDSLTFSRYKYIKNNDIFDGGAGGFLNEELPSGGSLDFSDENLTTMAIGGALAAAGLLLLGPIGLLAGAFMLFGAKERKIKATKKKLGEHLNNIEKSYQEEISSKFLPPLFEKASRFLNENAQKAYCSLHPGPVHTEQIKLLFSRLDAVRERVFSKETLADLLIKEISP